jgi:hypothetical protein
MFVEGVVSLQIFGTKLEDMGSFLSENPSHWLGRCFTACCWVLRHSFFFWFSVQFCGSLFRFLWFLLGYFFGFSMLAFLKLFNFRKSLIFLKCSFQLKKSLPKNSDFKKFQI